MGAFDTRAEMTEAFEALTIDRNSAMREYSRYKFGENPLKSYMVEVDYPEDVPPIDRVTSAFSENHKGVAVYPTDDSTLVQVVTDAGALYSVDCLDSRFWVVHTTDTAKASDILMESVAQNVFVDHLWLPTTFLRGILELGQPYGFSTSFDTDYFSKRPRGDFRAVSDSLEDEDAEPDFGIQSLKIQMSGTDAGRALTTLEESESLYAHLALSRSKVRHGDASSKSTDDVRFDGRTIARGESFYQHMQLLRLVHVRYSGWLEYVEDAYRVRMSTDEVGAFVDGQPLTIEFPTRLADPQRFYMRLLSGVRPFRLWGIPQTVAGDYMRVVATDLHGGATLALDLAPTMMRVYLYSDTCANTVLRLFVNLQQTFSRNLGLTDGEHDLDLTIRDTSEATDE